MHPRCIIDSINYFFSLEPLKPQSNDWKKNWAHIFYADILNSQRNRPNQISFIYTFVQSTEQPYVIRYRYTNKTIYFEIQKRVLGYSNQSIQFLNLQTRRIKFRRDKKKHKIWKKSWIEILDSQNTSNKNEDDRMYAKQHKMKTKNNKFNMDKWLNLRGTK